MRRGDVHRPAIFRIRQPRFAPIRPTRGASSRRRRVAATGGQPIPAGLEPCAPERRANAGPTPGRADELGRDDVDGEGEEGCDAGSGLLASHRDAPDQSGPCGHPRDAGAAAALRMNDAAIDRAYRDLLDRAPEEPGVYAHWRAALTTEAELRAAMRNSPEYLERQARLDAAPYSLDGANPFGRPAVSFDPVALLHRHLAPDPQPVAGRLVNAFGVIVDPAYLPDLLGGREETVEGPPIPENWHADFAEFAAALRAVERARDSFAMAELGCGWGCWMAITGVAARRAGKQVRLIGVEADAGHIAFAQRCMTENGFAEGDFRLHRGVAAAQGGVALFPRQTQAGTHWGLAPVFGASEAEQRAAERSGAAEALPIIALETVIGDLERLDLLHVDIQGGEEALLTQTMELLTARVAHVCVGAHSRGIEGVLWRAFEAAGWMLEVERPALHVLRDAGARMCADGLQGWRNPRFD